MPADQRGSLVRPSRGRGWAYRIYVDGKRTYKGGFETKSEASAALKAALAPAEPERVDYTVQQVVEKFLDRHIAQATTIATLTHNLKHLTRQFGDQRLDELDVDELEAWSKRLKPATRWHAIKAARQIGHYAVRREWIAKNPFSDLPNPSRHARRSKSSPRRKSTRSRSSSVPRCR